MQAGYFAQLARYQENILIGRGGQYRGTVTRYFFSIVVRTVDIFKKMYRF